MCMSCTDYIKIEGDRAGASGVVFLGIERNVQREKLNNERSVKAQVDTDNGLVLKANFYKEKKNKR